jgi:hypothetical protein
MTNYDVTIYNSLYEAEQALEGIDNAINIVAIPFKDGVLTKILLLTGIGEQLEQTISENVDTSGTSDDIYVLGKSDLTVEITATSVTEGASIKIQGTSDNVNYGDLGVVDNTGNINQTISITNDGTYFYEVVNASSLKYVTWTTTITGNPVDIFEYGIFINENIVNKGISRNNQGFAGYGNLSGTSILDLSDGDEIRCAIRNIETDGDITIYNCNVAIVRI